MRAIIPAIVTCVIIAGALVRYFYNMWHDEHVAGAVVGVARGGGRDLGGVLDRDGGLAGHAPRARPRPTPDPIAGRGSTRREGARRRGRRRRRRAARCATRPSRCGRGSARRPRASCSTRPEHIAAFAPAIRMQAVLTHAMPPNNLTEMTAGGARDPRALARRREVAQN